MSVELLDCLAKCICKSVSHLNFTPWYDTNYVVCCMILTMLYCRQLYLLLVYHWLLREGCKKRPFFIVFYYEGVRTPPGPPPFIVTWDSEIFGPYFNVVVDAIGPETDFTLETNRNRVKEKPDSWVVWCLAGGCLSAARFDLVSTWMGDRLLNA